MKTLAKNHLNVAAFMKSQEFLENHPLSLRTLTMMRNVRDLKIITRRQRKEIMTTRTATVGDI